MQGSHAHAAPPLARFAGASKSYGAQRALAPLELELARGEVLGLLGPNGAGKTTAVRLLCGLLAPDQGSVSIDGIELALDPLEARRRYAFVPDGAPLYAALSAREHLALVGRLHALSEDEIERRGSALLLNLGLLERARDASSTYSRGMRQKLALALALLPRPPLLVLDEPLTGLDAPSAAAIKEVLRRWADQGGGVLYTSHLLDVVERVADRIAILDRGELVACGTLEELRSQAGERGNLERVFQLLTRAEDPTVLAQRIVPAGEGPRGAAR
jgi:ABC-2 type transport system ATP-binding protein